jgi:hypothetical protein
MNRPTATPSDVNIGNGRMKNYETDLPRNDANGYRGQGHQSAQQPA